MRREIKIAKKNEPCVTIDESTEEVVVTVPAEPPADKRRGRSGRTRPSARGGGRCVMVSMVVDCKVEIGNRSLVDPGLTLIFLTL